MFMVMLGFCWESCIRIVSPLRNPSLCFCYNTSFTSLATCFLFIFQLASLHPSLHSSLCASSDLVIPRSSRLCIAPVLPHTILVIGDSIMRGCCSGFFGSLLFVGGDRIVVMDLHVPVHLWVMTSSTCIFCSFRLKSGKGGVHPALNLGFENLCKQKKKKMKRKTKKQNKKENKNISWKWKRPCALLPFPFPLLYSLMLVQFVSCALHHSRSRSCLARVLLMAPLATSVELPFSLVHSVAHSVFLQGIMSSSHSAWEDGLVPIHSVGYWLHHWFWSSTPATSLTSCFPLVKGLPSLFTRVALLCLGEWTFPSPPFTHHYFIAARSSWCIPTPCFGPVGWGDVAVLVVAQFQVTIFEGTGLPALGGLRFIIVEYVSVSS
eukprot:Gb_37239 [translate_table: standard]